MLLLLACADDSMPKTDSADTGDTGTADSADSDTTETNETADSADTACTDAPEPAAPSVPDTVGTLTVTVRNGDGFSEGTDDETLELCLRDDRCFALAVGDGEPLDASNVGVWSFEDVGLGRADIDQVTLRTQDGSNQWQPTCIDLRFDGEPVHCASLDLEIGDGGDEYMSWTDPDGLHDACGTCWDGPLTHGPMIGAVTPESARIWVRTDATRSVSLTLTHPERRVAAWAQPRAEDDFTAELLVACLLPDTRYEAELAVDGATVWTGGFTTPPPAGTADAWRFAFGSCARWDDQPIFATIADTEPDLFFFIGDNTYANTDQLDVARHHYRHALAIEERAALLATTPILATWDDHDFTGDNTDGSAAGKDDVLRAFTEYWANPAYGTVDLPGVFFGTSRGDVDLFVLDDRYHRNLDGSMLGAEQRAWLIEALTASDATFKLVATGSVWNEDGAADSWDDYLDERAEIFEATAGVDGVVLLSGDVHRAEIRELAGPAYPLPELVSSPLANLATFCGTNAELIACYDGGDAWISVDIDTTVADPTLTATIRDVDGADQGSATWHLSELTAP